jgi:hypothetical protein
MQPISFLGCISILVLVDDGANINHIAQRLILVGLFDAVDARPDGAGVEAKEEGNRDEQHDYRYLQITHISLGKIGSVTT